MGGDFAASQYLWYGLSANTRAGYDAATGSFEAFCRSRGWRSPWYPASEDRVCAWVAHLAQGIARKGAGLAKKTLKRKLAGLVSWHTDIGADCQGCLTTRVERVVRGANAYHGVGARAQALPITLPILRKMVGYVRRHPAEFGGAQAATVVVCVFSVAFACFLRLGEITYDAFDGRFDLKNGDFVDGRGRTSTLRIPASKTDPFRTGIAIVVPASGDELCPVKAIKDMRRAVGVGLPADPLFRPVAGVSLKRATVVRWMERALAGAGYAAKGFSGHSFRRGAATWAASIGMSATEIKTMGRWNSDCYKLYINAGAQNHEAMGARLLDWSAHSTLPASGIPAAGQVWRPSL